MHDLVITESPQTGAGGKVFTSPHGKLQNGKKCKKLRELTQDDPEFASFWTVEIGQSVVELEDGSHAVVLQDEVK